MKVPRILALAMCLLFCLSSLARAQGETDAAEAARQLASAADDNAASLGTRRESLGKLEEAARLWLAAGETVEAARALTRAGRLHLRLNDSQAALAAHQQALALLNGVHAPEAEADALNGLGAAYLHIQKRESAEKPLRRALALSEQAGYAYGRAQALLTLSGLQNYSDHVLGLRTAQEALEVWQSLGDQRGLALTHEQMGDCYMAQNMLAESAQNYERALQLWRDVNDAAGQAEAIIHLGFVELRRGESQAAIAPFMQAQALIDEEAEPMLAVQITGGLAGVFREVGSFDKMLTHYLRALDLCRRTEDRHAILVLTWAVGQAYFLQRDYPHALARFRELLAAPDKDITQDAAAHEYIARISIETGDPAAALPDLLEARAVYERAGNAREAAQVQGLLGRAHELLGQTARARKSYTDALASFETLSDRVNQSAVYYALGRLELGQGNYEEAEEHLRRSVEVTENMRRVSTSKDLMTAFSATVHERYEAYVECLMRMDARDPSRGLTARAFESSEASRARALAELLRATGSSLVPGLDPRLAEQESSLRRSLRVKEDARVALLGGKYEKKDLEALDAERARLEEEYRRVDETIRARHPSYGQIERPGAWDLRRIQEQVVADDQTVLLEYSLGAERGYVWVVTRDRIESRELPGREAVSAAARNVYELLSADPRRAGYEEELNRATEELGRMVLSPVAGLLGGRRVIVVGDDALNYIPFQLLPDPSAGGEPLVAAHEVVGAPSASTLGQLREETARRREHAKTLAAFGDPVFASNYAMRRDDGEGVSVAALRLRESGRDSSRGIKVNGDSFDPSKIEPLWFAGDELRNLREVVAGDGAFVVSGFGATRERLQSTDLGEFAILHFATHGLLNPTQPENSGLMLSTVDEAGGAHEGFVSLRDIYNLRAPVDLVVLSACRTALGQEVRGEGLIGLTRGFLYAGASGVVSSLWKVDDEATAELMRRFYANMLREGMTPAAALRAAQNSIRQRPEWRSPHYWAAFTIQGEYRQVIRPTRPAPALYVKAAAASVLLLLLALAASAAWWYQRRRASSKSA